MLLVKGQGNFCQKFPISPVSEVTGDAGIV